MLNSNPEKMKTHTAIAGWLLIANYALMLLGALIAYGVLSGVRALIDDSVVQQVLDVVRMIVPVVLTIFAVPGILAGIGLLTNQPWARILAIIMAILGLTNVPVGTAIGAYVLWVLLSNQQPVQKPPTN